MVNPPINGPLNTRWGPYVRNIQPIPDHPRLFLCEAQDGLKGKGKLWRPRLLYPNPKGLQIRNPGTHYEWIEGPYNEIAGVKPATSQHRQGQFKVMIWGHPDHIYVEGYFPKPDDAVNFMIHTAKAIFP